MKSLKNQLGLMLVVIGLLSAAASADMVSVYSLAADDGCISMDPAASGASWNAQMINAGDEDHWLGTVFPLAGLVKFILPTDINPAYVTSVSLKLYTWARADDTSLGAKAGDINYPNGPFCVLQHFTSDRAAGLNPSDATAATEDIAIKANPSWQNIFYDVTTAVKADMAAGFLRSSFRTQAVDYTGRILTVADKTEFFGYLTSYGTRDLPDVYSDSWPMLTIEYIPEPATILLLSGAALGMLRKRSH